MSITVQCYFIPVDFIVENAEDSVHLQTWSEIAKWLIFLLVYSLLVSAFMQKHAAFYANFIDEGRTISQFCETVSLFEHSSPIYESSKEPVS